MKNFNFQSQSQQPYKKQKVDNFKDINKILEQYDFDLLTLENLITILNLYKEYKQYKSVRHKTVIYFNKYHSNRYPNFINFDDYIKFITNVFFDNSNEIFDEIININLFNLKNSKRTPNLLVKLYNEITFDERFKQWYHYQYDNDTEILKYRIDTLRSLDINKEICFDEKLNIWCILYKKFKINFLNTLVYKDDEKVDEKEEQINKIENKNIKEWSIGDVKEFLGELEFDSKIINNFENQKINGQALLAIMNKKESIGLILKDLGITLMGDILRFQDSLEKLIKKNKLISSPFLIQNILPPQPQLSLLNEDKTTTTTTITKTSTSTTTTILETSESSKSLLASTIEPLNQDQMEIDHSKELMLLNKVEKKLPVLNDEVIILILMELVESVDLGFNIYGLNKEEMKRYSMVSKQFFRIMSDIIDKNLIYYEWNNGTINGSINSNKLNLIKSPPTFFDYKSINLIPYSINKENLNHLFSKIEIIQINTEEIQENMENYLKQGTVENNHSKWILMPSMPLLHSIYINNGLNNFYDFNTILNHIFESSRGIQVFNMTIHQTNTNEKFNFIGELLEGFPDSLRFIVLEYKSKIPWKNIVNLLMAIDKNSLPNSRVRIRVKTFKSSIFAIEKILEVISNDNEIVDGLNKEQLEDCKKIINQISNKKKITPKK